MTETKIPYTIVFDKPDMFRQSEKASFVYNHEELVSRFVRHDARRLEAGESVEYAPGKTARLMTDEEQAQHESVEQFYADVSPIVDSGPMVWLPPYYGLDSADDTEIALDGHFTLEQLKAIVAAWEKLRESTKPIDTTANAP